jgi:hypothetical protein
LIQKYRLFSIIFQSHCSKNYTSLNKTSLFFIKFVQNSTLGDQRGTEHQFSGNSFQNKFPYSNETHSFHYKLESAINEIFLTVLAKNSSNIVKKIFFEDERTIGVHLSLPYDYRSTTAPFSIETERAFSAANQISTKIRYRLKDTTSTAVVS